MNNKDFWESVNAVIAEGFTTQGLQKLDEYAEQFVTGRLVYQRFSSAEQPPQACGQKKSNTIIPLTIHRERGQKGNL